MVLDHTIVPAHDKRSSAAFFAELFGVDLAPPLGPFSPVRINDALTFDFAESEVFEPHHYAFYVTDEEFDAIFARVEGKGLTFSSDPVHKDTGHFNHRRGGRGFYVEDPNGHNLEVLTRR